MRGHFLILILILIFFRDRDRSNGLIRREKCNLILFFFNYWIVLTRTLVDGFDVLYVLLWHLHFTLIETLSSVTLIIRHAQKLLLLSLLVLPINLKVDLLDLCLTRDLYGIDNEWLRVIWFTRKIVWAGDLFRPAVT